MENTQTAQSLFGYFEQPTDEAPVYDPGLDVPCVLCFKPLNHPVEAIVTISFSAFFDGADKSYFYRAHKHCYDTAETDDIGNIEASVMGDEFGSVQDIMRPGLFAH